MSKGEYMKSKGVWCILKPSILAEEVDNSFKEFVEGILKASEIYLTGNIPAEKALEKPAKGRSSSGCIYNNSERDWDFMK